MYILASDCEKISCIIFSHVRWICIVIYARTHADKGWILLLIILHTQSNSYINGNNRLQKTVAIRDIVKKPNYSMFTRLYINTCWGTLLPASIHCYQPRYIVTSLYTLLPASIHCYQPLYIDTSLDTLLPASIAFCRPSIVISPCRRSAPR